MTCDRTSCQLTGPPGAPRQIFINNRAALSNATTIFSSLASATTALARRTNTLANARLNISAHYDISNAMFAAFLSSDMTYSCPIWRPLSTSSSSSAGGPDDETLEEAQMTKLHHFINQAHIRARHHVLEIGTGWGSFAIEAVRRTGCRVTSLTLSVEQQKAARERIAAAGLADRIDVRLCDYRKLPAPAGEAERYDRVVSIEMLEAVGAEFLAEYFGLVDRALRADGGVAVFQCITIPETRYAAYATGTDFIRRYIFPGGHLPTVSALVGAIERGAGGRLVVDEVRNIGGHYAKTLRVWRENFQRNFEAEVRPALRREHPDMDEQDVELFRRKWEVSRPRVVADAEGMLGRVLTGLAVLFHVLRSGVPDQDLGRRDHHGRARRCRGDAGRYSILADVGWSLYIGVTSGVLLCAVGHALESSKSQNRDPGSTQNIEPSSFEVCFFKASFPNYRFTPLFFCLHRGISTPSLSSASLSAFFPPSRNSPHRRTASRSNTSFSLRNNIIVARASSTLLCAPPWIPSPSSSLAKRRNPGDRPPTSRRYGACRPVSLVSLAGCFRNSARRSLRTACPTSTRPSSRPATSRCTCSSGRAPLPGATSAAVTPDQRVR